jgi:ribosome-associated translation inhibitor RaiA
MHPNIQSRGFSLTAAMRAAVYSEAHDFALRFPKLTANLEVRLFDVNGRRGGIHRGCLVHVRVGQGRMGVVASDLDTNLYRAITAAFEKLERGTQTVLGRNRAQRHDSGGYVLAAE